MLQRIRDNASGPLAYVVVAVIALVFGVWGIGSYFTPSSDPVVASVGSSDITRYQLQQAYNQRYQRLRQLMGDNFNPDLLPPDQLRRTVLQGLIDDAVLNQYAESAGYRVTDARLLGAIRSDPQFQVDGQFSAQRYRALLSQAGIPAARYEARLRDDLKSRQLRQDITGTAFASPAEVDQAYRLANQQRRVRYLQFDPARYAGQVEASDQEIKTYYDEHADQFQRPERLKLAYVALTRSNAGADAKAPDEQALRDLYDQNKAKLGEPEKRSGAQIRIPIDDDASAARERVQKLAERVSQGADFEEVAQGADGVEYRAIDGATQQGLSPVEVTSTFFELDQGKTSAPVKGADAWYLLRVSGVTPASTPAFDDPDVQAQLKAIASAQRAANAYSDKSDRMESLAYEAPNDLKTLADELGLEIQHTGWITREQGEDIGQYDAIRKAAFSDAVSKDKLNSTPIQLGSDRRVVLRVEDKQAAQRRPLDAVRDRIRERIETRKASEQARDAAKQALAQLKNGKGADALAGGDSGPTLESPGFVQRSSDTLDPRIRETAFSLAQPSEKTPGYDITATSNGVIALVIVDGVRAGEQNKGAPRQQFAQQQRSYIAQQEYAVLASYLRNNADVEINESRID